MVSSGIGSSATRSVAGGAGAEDATAAGALALAVASGAMPVVVGAAPAEVEVCTMGGPRPGGGREGAIPGGGAVLLVFGAGVVEGAEANADEEVMSEMGFFLGEA